jgi:hypothetical protein
MKTVDVIPAVLLDNLIATNPVFRYLPKSIAELLYKYGHGSCCNFAIVASNLLKKRIIGFKRLIDGQPEDEIVHYAVLIDDKSFLLFDVYGYVKPSSVVKRYGPVRSSAVSGSIRMSAHENDQIHKDIDTLKQFFKLYDVQYA